MPVVTYVDPSCSPDGACWTVVCRQHGVEVHRYRYGDSQSAEIQARQLILDRSPYLIHIEGPDDRKALD